MPHSLPRFEPDALDARAVLERIEILPPRAIFARLESLGYRGQESARRTACLFAYRHMRRLHRLIIQNIPRSHLPPKSNLMLIGPTGSGKTFLFELLFGEIFPLPHVIVDVTRFTESGYIGRDIVTVLTQLLEAAEMNVSVAQIGVVALDEIDKIALQQSSARYAGEGTTKDVKGNVQKELLQILGGSDVAVPVGHTSDYGRSVPMSTRDIGFVAAGAFSELKELAARRHAARIGFAGSPEPAAPDVTATEEIDVELLQEYGFLPEFTARFGRAVRLAPLTPDELRTILHDNILPPLVREFELEGVALEFGPAQTERFIEQALARKTGARGLRAAVEHYVEDLAFERFGETRKRSTTRAPRAKRKPRDAGRESP